MYILQQVNLGVRILSAQNPATAELYERAGLPNLQTRFRKLLAGIIPAENVTLHDILSERLPSSVQAQLIILPGSGYHASEIIEKVPGYPTFLRKMRAAGKSILGICSGHQVFAEALGGKVHTNPQGPEVGTTKISLRDGVFSSLLFSAGGIPRTFAVSQFHFDAVTRPAELPDTELLAWNEKDAYQVIRYGLDLTVQFHPEIDGKLMCDILELRWKEYFKNDRVAYEKCLAGVSDTPHARQVIHNYLKFVVLPRVATLVKPKPTAPRSKKK